LTDFSARFFSRARHGSSQAEPIAASMRRSASAAAMSPDAIETDFSLSGSMFSARRAVVSSTSRISLAGNRPSFAVASAAGEAKSLSAR
jgi:hypothetical protein